ncbi:unnamed protein product [Cyprideis torosa]|uniref:lysozyme n=1 Tax=Cyprideis torosa TaxID=163714 RepID=A0A7R8WJM7_9CRUS|nr:unnamed protein product [Cyprideis torosa]CAG0895911.1 unnamed protein product [Cyprideis torosa]
MSTPFQASAKVYGRCELARELVNVHGISRAAVGDWVCLMYRESRYRTYATHTNSNGSKDYGILQINNRYWCDPPTNGCNMSCRNLLNNDLRDDMKCAKIIYKEWQRRPLGGFSAWNGWKYGCRGKDVEAYVRDCF